MAAEDGTLQAAQCTYIRGEIKINHFRYFGGVRQNSPAFVIFVFKKLFQVFYQHHIYFLPKGHFVDATCACCRNILKKKTTTVLRINILEKNTDWSQTDVLCV